MKVLAIVVGSMIGLVLLAVVALAILLPLVGSKMIANARDPRTQRTTTSKIGSFVVPRGFRLASAIDLGVTQTAIVAPADRSKYSVTIQLTAQHLADDDDAAMMDQMSSGIAFGEKIRGCALSPRPDETIVVRGRPLRLKVSTCERDGAPLVIDVAIVHTRAATVEVVASDVRTADDRAAVTALITSFH